MSLGPGIRLGAYEIVALIGAGGMGEVYRARDSRLGRDVAIKVLPDALASDVDRLARFEQEARAAASLNHPNILALHDIGSHAGAPYIVTELLEGDTLRDRLHRGALSVRKAIEYAVQVARGLAAAHDKGIVHRDLKPENLFITTDGRLKILDFGLAKLTHGHLLAGAGTDAATNAVVGAGRERALSPAKPDTVPGMLLGTMGYMSPEQVRGLTADYRSDIFALGAILYEMLSGRRAFRGDTTADTMTAILREEPPDLGDDLHVSPGVRRLVERCLEKSPGARFQSTGDLAFALESVSTHSESRSLAESLPGPTPARWRAGALAGTALVCVMATAAALYVNRERPDLRAQHATILPPPGTMVIGGTPGSLFGISPDGRRLAVSVVDAKGRRVLWIQNRETGAMSEIQGSEGALYLFWSPDSRFVGFMAGGYLKKVDVAGGTPIVVSPAPGGLDGTWGGSDVILFAAAFPGKPRTLWRVPAAGGEPSPATTLDLSVGENRHTAPYFLPDGRRFLYFAIGSKEKGVNDARAVYVGTLDAGAAPQLVLQGGSNAKYAGEHLLFMRAQTLFAQPFDVSSLTLAGQPVALAQGIATASASGQVGAFSVSTNGVLTYLTGAGALTSQLVWVDRAGQNVATFGEPGTYDDLELSPDGRRLAVSMLEDLQSGRRDIWIYDLPRGVRSRFTFGDTNDYGAAWSPDGATISYTSDEGDGGDLYLKTASGASTQLPLLRAPYRQAAFSWSPDGQFLLYQSGPVGGTGGGDLWVVRASGDRPPVPFLQTPFAKSAARISPDGRWVAYASNESGNSEIYVTSFPRPGGKWQVSVAGGQWPRWRRDGREIYYIAPDRRLMAASVDGTGAAFEIDPVQPLFVAPGTPASRYVYDVAADGERFLLPRPSTEFAAAPLTLVVNWQALLDAGRARP